MNSRQRKKLAWARLASDRLDETLKVQRETGLAIQQMEKREAKRTETIAELQRMDGYILTRMAHQDAAIRRLRENGNALQKKQAQLAAKERIRAKSEATLEKLLWLGLGMSLINLLIHLAWVVSGV